VIRLIRLLLPWPTRAERRAAIEAAASALDASRARRPEVDAVVGRLADLRERNHFREAFEASLRRSP
jgi:hypothetical protein